MERTDIGTFLMGVAAGAAVAALFTPSSGTKTRAQITKAAEDGFKDMRDAVLGAVERSKDQIARQKEGVTEAIKCGSEAYRRAVS
jgi:gas vesicle protein